MCRALSRKKVILKQIVELQLETRECNECHIIYGVPMEFIKWRREDHKTFWCPNGHARHFPQENEAEALRTKLRAENLARESAERRAREAEQSNQLAIEAKLKLERAVKRAAKRTAAGVCPCCPRTFTNLARHIATKHPEFNQKEIE